MRICSRCYSDAMSLWVCSICFGLSRRRLAKLIDPLPQLVNSRVDLAALHLERVDRLAGGCRLLLSCGPLIARRGVVACVEPLIEVAALQLEPSQLGA